MISKQLIRVTYIQKSKLYTGNAISSTYSGKTCERQNLDQFPRLNVVWLLHCYLLSVTPLQG